ncbi:hypothetical protein NN561_016044 [Cricetulus griseus]
MPGSPRGELWSRRKAGLNPVAPAQLRHSVVVDNGPRSPRHLAREPTGNRSSAELRERRLRGYPAPLPETPGSQPPRLLP